MVSTSTIGKLITTVTLGKYLTTAKLREEVETAGHMFSGYAGDILAKTPVSEKKFKLDLFGFTVAELGFARVVTVANIYRRAADLGFSCVPAEAGPLLRLRLGGRQALDELLLIGMEPLTDRSGSPRIFTVGRNDGGWWLDTYRVRTDDRVRVPRARWVFGRAK